jgi:hypothetical protein
VPVIETLGKVARITLGGVRIATGTTGLLAPEMIISRFDEGNPKADAAAVFGLRLFGIRTILIGADLIRLHGRDLDHALRAAPLVHATDTATVLRLQRTGQLSPERARPLARISGLNTALAMTAYLASRRSRT